MGLRARELFYKMAQLEDARQMAEQGQQIRMEDKRHR